MINPPKMTMSEKQTLQNRLKSYQTLMVNAKKFKSKRNKELENLINEPLNLNTNLIIRLPNKWIVDITIGNFYFLFIIF